MKTSLLLLIGLLLLITIGNSTPLKSDSLKVTKKHMDSLVAHSHITTRLNDSLTRELLYYRVKDDYYAMAIDRQGTHFEWFISFLMTILGAAAGLITYGFIKRKINKVRKEANLQISESKEVTLKLKDEFERLKHRLYMSVSLSFTNIVAFNPPPEGDFNLIEIALNLSVISLHYLADAYHLQIIEGANINRLQKISVVKEINHSIDHINFSLNLLETFLLNMPDPADKSRKMIFLKERYPDILKVMDKLITVNDDEFTLQAITLKERFKAFLK